MKKKTVIIGAIAATTVLAGGWALAQSVGQGPNGFGPPFMRGQGPDGMGPGMMHGMHHGMGPGMMKGMDHGMGPNMMKGMGPGTMHGRAGLGFADPAEIESLKSELGITPAQETAWAKYAKAVQDAATAMKTTREGVDPDAVSKMAPADRYAFVSKMREERQKQFSAAKTAADELLETLDTAQKAKAADILPGLAFGPGAMRGAIAGDHQHRH
jgi:LTXXQ motif family protein